MHQRYPDPTVPAPKCLIIVLLIGSLLTGLTGVLPKSDAIAAPGDVPSSPARHQNVDYLDADAAVRLNLDFPVLVPSYVPAPFSGQPAVDASGDSYSLYWMNTGGPPTFLQVSGQVGGSLPAGSPADLNSELTINASVQGNAAIHDVTDTYDAVWWISGGVLYSVQSRNMETDSLSLANSLIGYVGPAVENPADDASEDTVPGDSVSPTEAPEVPDENTDPGVDDIDAPDAANETTDTLDEATEGSVNEEAGEPDVLVEVEAEPTTEDPAGPTAVTELEPTAVTELEPTAVGGEEPVEISDDNDASGGGDVGSDGTGGAPLPVFGGDGTGGTMDLVIPDPGE